MSDTDTLARAALGYFQAGRFAEAVPAFERLLASEPDLGNHWHRLAFSLRHLRRFDEALDAYQQALDHGGDKPEEIHLNRAIVYARQFSDTGAAISELDAALAIDPGYVPALLYLGIFHEELGDRDTARKVYERAQEADPDSVAVLTRLAMLGDIDDADHPLLKRVEAVLSDPGVAAREKSDLGYTLGQIRDSLGRYDEAFAAYRAANETVKAERAQADYNSRLEAQYTDRIIRAFPKADPRASETGEEKPIFVCGMFRSGSTLAEQILARHSRVTAGGELELILAIVERGFNGYPEGAAGTDARRFAQLRQSYLEQIAQIHPGADLITDKQTFNFRHIGLIKRMFPGARIVDTLRNPLDNGLALYFANLGSGVPFAVDLDYIVHFYRDYRRMMTYWQECYPDSIHALDYDALVADPEPQIRELVDFCGLEWEEACLEPHKVDTAVRTPSAWQVRQPFYTSSSGRWRNYEKHIGPLIEAFPPSER